MDINSFNSKIYNQIYIIQSSHRNEKYKKRPLCSSKEA